MGRLRTLVVCGAALAISAAAARAADMPDYSPFPAERSSRPVELYSGWYLRGDVGYRFQHNDGASDLSTDYTGSTLENTYVGSIGAGYKVQWFRADLTGDYGWRNNYSATATSGSPTVSAKFDTFTVMGNAYIDMGTWAGFTPYIGAGIGAANLSMREYMSTPPQVIFTPTVQRWNFAWAAMAGVSYNLRYNLLVDLGYRHVNMGDAVGGPAKNLLTVNKLTGDEIRIGLRYLID